MWTKLLPYENYRIASSLTKEDVLIRLFDKTLSAQEFVSESDKRAFSFGMKGWSKPYWGTIQNDRFELERLITYRNFGNPKVIGTITQTSEGISVHVRMKPPDATLILIGLLILGCLSSLLKTLTQSTKQHEIPPEVFVASGMIAFAYSLLLISFKAESVKTKRFLAYLFKTVNQPAENAAQTGLPK